MNSDSELLSFPDDSMIVDLDFEYNPYQLVIRALEISIEEREIEKRIKINTKNNYSNKFFINNFLTQIIYCSFYQNKCKISINNWFNKDKDLSNNKSFNLDLIPQFIIAAQIDDENNIVRFLGVMTFKEFTNFFRNINQQSIEPISIPIFEFNGGVDLLFDYVTCLDSKSIDIDIELYILLRTHALNIQLYESNNKSINKESFNKYNLYDEIIEEIVDDKIHGDEWDFEDDTSSFLEFSQEANYIKSVAEYKNIYNSRFLVSRLEDKYDFLEKIVEIFPQISEKEKLKLIENIDKSQKALKLPYKERTKIDNFNIELGNKATERIISSNLKILISISKKYINYEYDLFALSDFALNIMETAINEFNANKFTDFSDLYTKKLDKFFALNINDASINEYTKFKSIFEDLSIKLLSPPSLKDFNEYHGEEEDILKYVSVFERFLSSERDILGLIYSYLKKDYLFNENVSWWYSLRSDFDELYDYYIFENSIFEKDYPQTIDQNKSKIQWWYFFKQTSKFFELKSNISDISKINKKEKLKDCVSLLKKEDREILELRFGLNKKHLSFNILKKYLKLSSEELINCENNIRRKLKAIIFKEKESFVPNK